MVVGDSYKARIAEKRAIGANRGELKVSKAAVTGGAEIEHVEAVAVGEGKPKKRQRFKRHLARFWCCYLLAGFIFLAIFLPVLYDPLSCPILSYSVLDMIMQRVVRC
jgi:hypothetical protein